MEKYYISSTKYSTQERMTRRGKVYDIVFRIVTLDGEEKQKKLCGFKTKGAANEAYIEFVQNYCELVKNNPIKKKKTAKANLTVKDLFAEYIISLQNQNKDSTVYDKTHIFDLFILPEFGTQSPNALTVEALYRWQDALWATKNPKTGEYYSYAYLKKTRSHFASFLEWAKHRYGYANSFELVKQPKRRTVKRQMEIWTVDEFNKFIAVVDNEMYKMLFSMLFYTGRRKGEIFALQKNDVTPEYIIITKSVTRKTIDGKPFNVTSTKADKSQKIPICNTLKQLLQKYEGESPYYFGGEKPLAENTVTRVFNRYCAIADVKQIRIHDLRHSFVSMLIHLGANITVIADLIGDNIEQISKTYAHLYQEDKRLILSKI